MAVGLDTPASALHLFDAFAEDGMQVERPFADGDELMHALIATGGHDAEFLTDDQLAASPLRLPIADYLRWYAELPETLRAAIEGRWGPPPGDRYIDGDDFVVAGLELGNVLVAIQPPRGYGDDPVGIYHDPELPPTHHYLACYWWLDRVWGADAIVHLGKHGTLEWLPGKTLALSAECAPDAALGDIPLVYPFVVNDPGEGVQAKRRVHAVIVDHLVPPMMRADTYDEMAELEALLDEYARLEVLDPEQAAGPRGAHLGRDRARQPAVRPRRRGAARRRRDARRAHRRLPLRGQGHPDQGRPARARPAAARRSDARARVGDPAARLGRRRRPAQRPSARAYGLDEPALVAAAGAPAPSVAGPSCSTRFRGPSASAGDLVDRLEAAQMALLDALAARDWDAGCGRRGVCLDVLGRHDDAVERALRFAADEVVPRILQDDRRARQRARRAQRAARAVGTLGQPDARARRRAPDRPQLLLRRSARAALRALVGGRAAGSPMPCSSASAARRASSRAWSASSRGAPRRCARRATTSPRSSR